MFTLTRDNEDKKLFLKRFNKDDLIPFIEKNLDRNKNIIKQIETFIKQNETTFCEFVVRQHQLHLDWYSVFYTLKKNNGMDVFLEFQFNIKNKTFHQQLSFIYTEEETL